MSNSCRWPLPRLPVDPQCSITAYVDRNGLPAKRLRPPPVNSPVASPHKRPRLSTKTLQPLREDDNERIVQSSCVEEWELEDLICDPQMDPIGSEYPSETESESLPPTFDFKNSLWHGDEKATQDISFPPEIQALFDLDKNPISNHTIEQSPLPNESTMNPTPPKNMDRLACPLQHTTSYDDALDTLTRAARELEVLMGIMSRLGHERRDALARLQCAHCPGHQL